MALAAIASLRRSLLFPLTTCVFSLFMFVLISVINKGTFDVRFDAWKAALKQQLNFHLRQALHKASRESPDFDHGDVAIRALDPRFNLTQLPPGILDYMKWHHQQLKAPSKKTRYVIYACSSDCGGLGDRLRGIITLFYFSILTKRVFGIQWNTPIPLQEVLNASYIDWITPTDLCKEREKQTRLFTIDNPWFLFQLDLLGMPSKIARFFGIGSPKHMHGNNPCLLIYTNAQFFHSKMWKLGLRQALKLPQDTSYDDYPLSAWALNALFQSTENLDDQYARNLQRFNMTMDQPFVAVHVRLGSHAATFHDPVRHSISEMSLFASCARSMQSYVQSQRPSSPYVPIFVAADSNHGKYVLSELLNNETVYMEEEAFHIDRSDMLIRSKDATLLFRRTIAEFLLLMRSQCFVASHSGFSYLSILWSSHDADSSRCWSWFHVCLNTSVAVNSHGTAPWYVKNKLVADDQGYRDGFGHVMR